MLAAVVRGRRAGSFTIALALVASLMPAAASAASSAQFNVTLSATTFQVGDTVTFTPVVTNAAPNEVLRCEIWIEHYQPPDDWIRMHVSSSGCEPWTFVVPPGPLGQYEVVGRLYMGLENGQPTEHREVIKQVNLVAGGTREPFESNYPVQSWALDEVLSDPTPTLGQPLSVNPSPDAESCLLRIVGGLEASYVWQHDGCVPWTFTIPERDAQGPGTIIQLDSDVQVMAWIGESPYTIEPQGGFVGQMFGETYAVNVPDFAPGNGTVTQYASNLPAIFGGPQRGTTNQSGDLTPIPIEPVVVGTTEGTCGYSVLPGSSPVVPGGCDDPAVIPGFGGTGTEYSGVMLELRDAEGELLASGVAYVGWVDDMSTLLVTGPSSTDVGEETEIDASTDDGAPATYEVTAALEPTSALQASSEIARAVGTVAASETAAAGTVIASGVLDPWEESDGDSVAIEHAFAVAGRYRITVTFTDVRGETTSGSRIITVNPDNVAPTATTPKHAFATTGTVSSGKVPVRFTWSGSDAGAGIGRYVVAISTDGGAWSTISSTVTSASITRSLSGGHAYRFRVRPVDKAGNYGIWKYGSTFRVTSYQETSSRLVYTGTWTRPTSASYWGSYLRYAKAAGAKASITFTGRGYAWIGCVGPGRGSAKVYVNGTLVKTVSTYSATTACQKVLTTLSWSTASSRRVTIVVSGTSGHPRVAVDAIVVWY